MFRSKFKFSYLVVIFMVNFVLSQTQVDSIRVSDLKSFEKVVGLKFNQEEHHLLIDAVRQYRKSYERIRNLNMKNDVPYTLMFNPILPNQVIDVEDAPNIWKPKKVTMPENKNELAFFSISELAYLIKTKKITSFELTKFFIARLKKYDSKLHVIITITEERALESARNADKEIRSGNYKGLLHGIPFGVKDLIAVKGYKTTWGAATSKNQVIDETATIVKKLENAGGVLIAKLSLGALAWGDVWFGGKTRNPWNIEQGSSGSSAGSASATAAGLVPFAIGSETWGSIVSPSSRCGVTGLRPTFGRVSKYGAMALSWSMDKLGPIARSVEDAAIVFDAIRGTDNKDLSVHDYPFHFNQNMNIKGLNIAYFKGAFESETSHQENYNKIISGLKDMGANLIPIDDPKFNSDALSFILGAEAAAAFDDLTLSNKDDLLTRQVKNAWPNAFREARYITAVEYIQANRARYLLMQKMNKIMSNIDVLLSPTFAYKISLTTNLTGQPCIFVPIGFDSSKKVSGISVIGKLFDEGKMMSFAHKLQQLTEFHKQHPKMFED